MKLACERGEKQALRSQTAIKEDADVKRRVQKETFKNSVKENVKMLYRKNLEDASQQEIYQAVCYAVKDVIIDNWLKTQKAMEEQDPKILYYMSMEF